MVFGGGATGNIVSMRINGQAAAFVPFTFASKDTMFGLQNGCNGCIGRGIEPNLQDRVDDMYLGDVDPHTAYQALSDNPDAVLIDVRTSAEWAFVGVPAVERLLTISWQAFPSMQVNGSFVDAVRAAGVSENSEVYCICRSGARSAAAATALTQAGFNACYNVAEGFEGDLDGERHRGRKNGWKARGLPWMQS
jgi:rhodanese-related sulfurtransferase